MDNITLIMITIFIFSASLVIAVLNFIQHNKNKRIKKTIEKLEIEKNELASSPIVPELAKVESFLNNEKLQLLYDEWSKRLKDIKENQIPKLSDMILDAEYSINQMDYKKAMYKIAKLEMEMYKVRTNSDFLFGEIKEITSSEERSRSTITTYKAKYRKLYEKFSQAKEEYEEYENIVENEFETIAKRFEDFELIMDNNDFTEVDKLLDVIDELLNHISIVVDEVPSIALMTNKVLPERIGEIKKIYDSMCEEGYPLDYLNVEYNINEANSKIELIKEKTLKLDLTDSLMDLKVLLDYFNSLFGDFENERICRTNYEEQLNIFTKKLKKITSIVDDIFSQINEIRKIYNLSEEDIIVLNEVLEEVSKLNEKHKILVDHTEFNRNFAFSKLVTEIEGLVTDLSKTETKLDRVLNSLGTMRDDEIRARQQLEEIKLILKDSKLQLRDYNLPVVPKFYYTELKEASVAISEIVKELDKKPITIDVLNTRVDTARDLVLKLYTKTGKLIKSARFAEMAIIYGNRYRSVYEGLNHNLLLSEHLFYKGEYKESLEKTINLLNRIEPGIYDKLLKLYGEE